jgi:phage gpG-like protein
MSQAVAKVVVLEDHFQEALKAASGETLKKAVMAAGQVLEGYAKIKANEAFGPHATNTLAGSICTVATDADEHHAEVDVGPTVVYGRIHEFGGIIKPVLAKWLTFQTYDGLWHRVKAVHMPARPYLRPAFDEHQDAIVGAAGYQLKKAFEFSSKGKG